MATTNQPPSARKVVRFGAYEADQRSGELRKSGMRLKIGSQPFQVLVILLERRGDVVSREELRERIWPSGTFVDFENGLNKAVAKLRGILNDDSANPRFIETVPRHGYRFLAPVEFVEYADRPEASRGSATASSSHRNLTVSKPAIFWKRVLPALSAAIVLLVAAFSFSRHTRTPWAANSVAILPFENLSGDPAQDYFADGMTDELISDLARIKSLRVRSFTAVMRYQAGQKPLADIARELGVDAVVQGSVTRAGDRVRITARLTDPWHGGLIWVESYDTDLRDLSVTEAQLAKLIGRAVHANFDAEEDRFFSQTNHRVVPEAQEAYLNGHYLFYKQHRAFSDVQQSCDDFKKAIAADPGFAPAYVGMAQCLQWLEGRTYIPRDDSKAESFAHKAVELDPASAKAHAVLGSIFLYHDWDWPAAQEELQRAVEAGPNDAESHFLYSEYLKVMARLPEALVEIRRAQELDPLEYHYGHSSGYMLLYMHHFDEAEIEFKQVLQVQPDDISALTGLAEAYEKRQMLKQAAECWQGYERAEDEKPQVAPFMVNYGKYGFSAAKRMYLEARVRLGQGKFRRGVQWEKLNLAYLNAMLGRKREALNYLQLAYAAHLTPVINLRIDSRFDVLRDQPEFKNLLKEMKLVDGSPQNRAASPSSHT